MITVVNQHRNRLFRLVAERWREKGEVWVGGAAGKAVAALRGCVADNEWCWARYGAALHTHMQRRKRGSINWCVFSGPWCFEEELAGLGLAPLLADPLSRNVTKHADDLLY